MNKLKATASRLSADAMQHPSRSLKILVVDDDDVDRERVRRCLRSSTLVVNLIEAGSGQEAMNILQDLDIDCILLDNRLGDTTGSTLMQSIRHDTPYQGPIIMVTGAGSESLVVEALNEGASDYLTKVDLDAERLTQAILRSLQRQEARAAEEAATRQLSDQVEAQARTLRQLDRTLQDVLDQAPNVIAYWDLQETIRFGNPVHESWFGVDPHTLVGMRVQDLLGPELYALHAPHIAQALAGHAVRFEHRIEAKAGRAARIARVDYRPDRDDRGQTQGFYVTMTDLTELVLARDEAQESARLKSAFLANMSHEIRTPMNAILGLLRLTMDKTLGREVRGDLTRAHEAAQALMGILDDILDHSRMEAGQLQIQPQPVLLDDLVRRSVDLFSARMAQQSLRFQVCIEPSLPTWVLADGLRVSQVLNNLLGNAVKFTQAGQVTLRVTTGRIGQLRFEVQDTGPGIHLERQAALFSAFVQEDASVTRRFGGSGLGLSICRNLVELMHGQIGVSSEPGQGSLFWFELPLTPSPPVEPLANSPAQAGSLASLPTQRRVLLWSARPIPTPWIRHPGLETEHWYQCPTIDHVLQQLRQHRADFDVLLVDWDGEEGVLHHQLERLSREFGHPPRGMPPVVLITESMPLPAREASDDPWNDAPWLIQPVMGHTLQAALCQAQDGAPIPSASDITTTPWQAGARLKGHRVLLVEDNPLNQMVATAFLQQLHLDVTVADDGAQGVEVVRSVPAGHFDAILMDMHMPVMDGLKATRAIREHADWQHTPIIAMTAAVLPDDHRKCMDAGMVATIAKPIDADHLVNTLLNWIPAKT